VTTVVLKLFNLVKPDKAFFGEKDAQQLRVIRRMVKDLNLEIDVVGCPIVRESDGLALSSRNVFLSPEERAAALVLSRAIAAAKAKIAAGERSAQAVRAEMQALFDAEPLASVDYIAIVDSDTVRPVETLPGEVLIAVAVKVGKTRLIDNATVTVT
jgi:pantoate--beta-alanine ligase